MLAVTKKDNIKYGRNEIMDIATFLLACGTRLDKASCNKTLLWQESKAMNVAYKEIKAIVILLNAISGNISKAKLKKLHLDIAMPQSYKIYLAP